MTCNVPDMTLMVNSTPRPVKRESRCQQAVEKALKAYLFSHHVELIRTHILPRLLVRCVDFDQDFKQVEAACDLLTDYYIDTRYPEIGVSYNAELAEEAIGLAGRVLGFVEERMGEGE